MKVLHVLSDNIFSGAQNVVCQIIALFREKDPGTEMVFVCPEGPVREALEAREIRYVPLPALKAGALRQILRREMPDLVHAHDVRASVLCALACGRTPMISHIHNNHVDARRISLRSLSYLPAARKAAHIFWVSSSALEEYRFSRAVRNKSSVLFNVIDMAAVEEKAARDPEAPARDLVFAGRLTYQKHPQRLLSVAELLLARRPGLTMSILGDGELYEEMCRLAGSKGLADHVLLPGFASNPYGTIQKAGALLLTSRWEGTPMVALEAMSLGTPVVSTPTDGMKDLVRQGENGFLGETDEELAAAAAAILEDPALRRRMSEACRETARRINDTDSYYARIRNVYETALHIQ